LTGQSSNYDGQLITANGDYWNQAEVEDWLLALEHLGEPDLLQGSREQRVAQAYRSRSHKSAYHRAEAASARGGAGRRD
jgi:hypothetical protein